MYTDEELTTLEEEELEITELAIAVMLGMLNSTKADFEKELRSFYNKYGKDGVVTYAEARKWVSRKDRRKRLTVLYLLIHDKFSSTFSQLALDFQRMVDGIIKKESEFFDVDLKDDLSLTWGIDKEDWLDRLEADIELWETQLKIDIKRSMLQGKSIEQIIEQLDDRFDSMNNVLKKLGLTESSAINSIARNEIFKRMGIKKYKFYTQPDERRCEVCGSMHGVTFPISAYEVGVTASPLHPRCRCWEVPIRD